MSNKKIDAEEYVEEKNQTRDIWAHDPKYFVVEDEDTADLAQLLDAEKENENDK